MKAWVATWCWASDSEAVADELAAILPARWGESKVSQHVELLYALHTSTAQELAVYAKSPVSNPYRAMINGPFITCGHHPFLVVRKVSELEITQDETGLETVTWKEPDVYRAPPGEPPLIVSEGQGHAVKRRISGPLSSKPIWDRAAGCFKQGWQPGERPTSDE